MLSRRILCTLTNSFLLESRYIPPLCACSVAATRSRQRVCLTNKSNTPSAARRAVRFASSSTRWKARQSRDRFSREAKVQGLKSRAAFKLLEMNEKYKLFKPDNTVVDLGYAPGSWSQVAVNRTAPNGRVIGIDIIPVQPPPGVSTLQGNFLSPEIQAGVRDYVRDPDLGRPRKRVSFASAKDEGGVTEEDLEQESRGYIDLERHAALDGGGRDRAGEQDEEAAERERLSRRERDERQGRVVDVVLSDMSAPWYQTTGFWKNSISNAYFTSRMMNTSGIPFRDHVGSMDLCTAALTFCFDTLRSGGHFLCKYYQGAEDKALEMKLRRLFEKVHREKPESSRKESREAYFVALRRKELPTREEVFKD
ncbi:FtsJ-like methyltransferase-domain-containing protein [Lineolata rhizophorae]|uniref:rRNA methyltransferase 2, mitochondrial n=1 Tax=Lineolata rhizophorae TaxID=578093 RepID=A0A6A6P141_9PEZI|nr:FtsJ-like methyltransferase-domain-containing protein [Lineolata rhizophorae]